MNEWFVELGSNIHLILAHGAIIGLYALFVLLYAFRVGEPAAFTPDTSPTPEEKSSSDAASSHAVTAIGLALLGTASAPVAASPPISGDTGGTQGTSTESGGG